MILVSESSYPKQDPRRLRSSPHGSRLCPSGASWCEKRPDLDHHAGLGCLVDEPPIVAPDSDLGRRVPAALQVMGGCVGFAYEYELEDNGAEDKAADVEAGIHRLAQQRDRWRQR